MKFGISDLVFFTYCVQILIFSVLSFQYNTVLVCCSAPFDLAIALLVVMSISILILWNENYGDSSAKALHSFTDAMNTIREGMKN